MNFILILLLMLIVMVSPFILVGTYHYGYAAGVKWATNEIYPPAVK